MAKKKDTHDNIIQTSKNRESDRKYKKQFQKEILYSLEDNYPYTISVENLYDACNVKFEPKNNYSELSLINSIIIDLKKEGFIKVEPEDSFQKFNSNMYWSKENLQQFSKLTCKLNISGFELLNSYKLQHSSKTLEYLTKGLIVLTAVLAAINIPIALRALQSLQAVYFWVSIMLIFLILGCIIYYILNNFRTRRLSN